MLSGHWSVRIHAACSAIAWCCALNALWIAFTALGGIVAGIGPATVTVCILTRRRMRGEPVRLRDFAALWRREIVRGGVVVLPLLVVTAVLMANYMYFTALGPDQTIARLATLGALVMAVGVGAYVGPMYAHYDLPLRSYLIKASRFALANLASTVVLLFVFVVSAVVSAMLPVLLVTISVGAWLSTSTWLCVRFFEQNEDRLADATHGRQEPVRLLPTRPLRIR